MTGTEPPFRPYYDDGTVTIYHGDCREMSLTADVLLTDPPYGGGHYSSDVPVLTGELLERWVDTYHAVMVFGWPERLAALCIAGQVVPTEWVTWWPTNGRMRGFVPTGLWRESEHIACFGAASWDRLRQPHVRTTTPMPPTTSIDADRHQAGARVGDVWRDESPNLNPNQKNRRHPNEKPEGVVYRLVTVTDGVILDPFMGSGTTLAVAKSCGRRAIGVEIEERYCEIAAKRCAQGVLWESE